MGGRPACWAGSAPCPAPHPRQLCVCVYARTHVWRVQAVTVGEDRRLPSLRPRVPASKHLLFVCAYGGANHKTRPTPLGARFTSSPPHTFSTYKPRSSSRFSTSELNRREEPTENRLHPGLGATEGPGRPSCRRGLTQGPAPGESAGAADPVPLLVSPPRSLTLSRPLLSPSCCTQPSVQGPGAGSYPARALRR